MHTVFFSIKTILRFHRMIAWIHTLRIHTYNNLRTFPSVVSLLNKKSNYFPNWNSYTRNYSKWILPYRTTKNPTKCVSRGSTTTMMTMMRSSFNTKSYRTPWRIPCVLARSASISKTACCAVYLALSFRTTPFPFVVRLDDGDCFDLKWKPHSRRGGGDRKNYISCEEIT